MTILSQHNTTSSQADVIDGRSSPKRNYNGLLSMLERYAPFASEASASVRAVANRAADTVSAIPSYIDALPPFSELLRAVDSAPLYALTDDASNRCRQLVTDRVIDSFALPPLPVDGVCMADAVSAVYLRAFSPDDSGALVSRFNTQGFDLVAGFSAVSCLCHDVKAGALAPDSCAGELTVLSSMTIAMVIDRASRRRKFALLHMMNVMRLPSGCAAFNMLLAPSTAVDAIKGRLDSHGRVRTTATLSPQERSAIVEEASKHPQSAVEQLHYVDLPTHYVVSERAARVQENREPSKKRAARYDDREHWVLLDPEEVKVRMSTRTDNCDSATHARPLPHLRRAHNRVLRSERYTFKRGEVVRVRPTWVGDREWANGKMCYKVVSRLGANAGQA